MDLAIATETPVITKTKELCGTILEQESFQEMRRSIDAFAEDDQAREGYEKLCQLQDVLRQKQEQGASLTPEEIDEFEKQRESLVGNPVAGKFFDAQQQMHKVHETISQYVVKTLELGRVPNEDDFPKGGCGPSCGCSG